MHKLWIEKESGASRISFIGSLYFEIVVLCVLWIKLYDLCDSFGKRK